MKPMQHSFHTSHFRISVAKAFTMAQIAIANNSDQAWIARNFHKPVSEITRADIWEFAIRLGEFMGYDDRGLTYRDRHVQSDCISRKVARRRGWVELRTVCSHYASGWDCECGSGVEFISPSQAERLVAEGMLAIYDLESKRIGHRLNGLGQAVYVW
jgi:hypothetical protein